MKIVHIITGLNNGGAEGVLYRLVTHDHANEHIVISLMGKGKYGSLLKEHSIETYYLELSRGKLSLSPLILLKKIIKNEKPDVVQTWMSHADLIGGLVSKLSGHKNIVWNIRHSNLTFRASNIKTNAVVMTCMAVSKIIPKKIICCSEKTYKDYGGHGYPKSKMTVISNGYDFEKFNTDIESRNKIRKELNIADDTNLLGMVARYDPNKNHQGLLRALKLVKDHNSNFQTILVGRDLNNNNENIKSLIKNLELEDHIILLDQRSDIPSIMNALDVNILSSISGEGFPNVLAEAMACGTLCVATDIGDSKVIIDNYGWIVEANDDKLLADAILKALELKKTPAQWNKMKVLARKHITDNFSISLMIERYNKVWSSI
ncbi:glycosyltransferase [Psychrobacter sp. M13]|uniref:glycosyltransferase family 4 protein n=1 Tax=Psychrobacter sp. M13 TaxID=3067275 RepID=UPI00273A75B2|nr:glycosyltransferase [Psychrobacter sp. M13]WLP95225.1 glycosyltransferase [Psychrobacter sp. M13]